MTPGVPGWSCPSNHGLDLSPQTGRICGDSFSAVWRRWMQPVSWEWPAVPAPGRSTNRDFGSVAGNIAWNELSPQRMPLA
jgi:hypothetical protein